MSVVTVDEIKEYLGVIHDADDSKLQVLIDGAEDEALLFMDRPTLPSIDQTEVDECASEQPPAPSEATLAPSVRTGIYLIVQAMYEALSADEMVTIRSAAETKWMPYRNNLGV